MTFAELSKSVADAQLGNARLTDVKAGTYSIAIDGDKIFLVSDKKVKIPVNSAATLAGLRISTDAAKAATCKTTREARDSDNYNTLQKMIVAEGFQLSESTKFNVIHRLKIQDVATDSPVYKNEHYKGYPEYVKSARKAAAMPAVTLNDQTARSTAFSEATDALRLSGVKSTVPNTDEAFILMPVFSVTN
jgi:hypothetical protein